MRQYFFLALISFSFYTFSSDSSGWSIESLFPSSQQTASSGNKGVGSIIAGFEGGEVTFQQLVWENENQRESIRKLEGDLARNNSELDRVKARMDKHSVLLAHLFHLLGIQAVNEQGKTYTFEGVRIVPVVSEEEAIQRAQLLKIEAETLSKASGSTKKKPRINDDLSGSKKRARIDDDSSGSGDSTKKE